MNTIGEMIAGIEAYKKILAGFQKWTKDLEKDLTDSIKTIETELETELSKAPIEEPELVYSVRLRANKPKMRTKAAKGKKK